MKKRISKFLCISLTIIMIMPGQTVFGSAQLESGKAEIVQSESTQFESTQVESGKSAAVSDLDGTEEKQVPDTSEEVKETEEIATEEIETTEDGIAEIMIAPDEVPKTDEYGHPLTDGVRINANLKLTETNYTGSPITPGFSIKCNYQSYDTEGKRSGEVKNVVLRENVDYYVVYKNNINAGVATATAIGMGDYEFERTKTFMIRRKVAKGLKFAKQVRPFYLNEAGSGGLKSVLHEKLALYDGGNIVSPDNYDLEVNGDLTKPGTVRVTIQVKETGNYIGKAPKAAVDVTICDNTVTGAVEIDFKPTKKPLEYTGSPIKPGVTVKMDGKALGGKDYFIDYENNINAGTAKVVIYGKGKQNGKLGEKEFEILPKDIKTLKAGKLLPLSYRDDVTGINPKITMGKVVLVKDKDYVVQIDKNASALYNELKGAPKAIGTISIHPAEGCTNFSDPTGEGLKINYTVAKRNIGFGLLVNVVGNVVTDKAAQANAKPSVTVTYDGEPMVEGTDYTISYSTQYSAKDGRVTVIGKMTGRGIYTGKRNVKWVMMQKY